MQNKLLNSLHEKPKQQLEYLTICFSLQIIC